MNYIRQTPTEECPLTKEKQSCSISDCFGFRSIICSFIGLTIVITTALILQLVYDDNIFQESLNIHGAVATDNINCSQIGARILTKGGNALDAAIAATLCMAVVAPQKMSLGSGGYIMIYNHKDQENPMIIDFLSGTIPDKFEDIRVRIPALLRGLEYAHLKNGKLLWQDIVKPAALLARKGFEVSDDLANEATKNGNLYEFQHISAGNILILPNLADTLEAVARYGTNVFYNGTITGKIFQNRTLDTNFLYQMANYEPKLVVPQKSMLSHYAILYPSSSNFVQPMIEEINKLNITVDNASTLDSELLAAETLIKLARQLNTPSINYTKTSYTGVSAVDWQDTYVSIICGLSTPLDLTQENGAGFVFDVVENNSSLQSLAPIIFYDESAICGLRGVFAADDSVIIGELLYNLLLRSMDVSMAVEYPRFYVLPDGITVENDENDNKYLGYSLLYNKLITLDSLSQVNSKMIMKSINVIIKHQNLINGHSDSRGDGWAHKLKTVQ